MIVPLVRIGKRKTLKVLSGKHRFILFIGFLFVNQAVFSQTLSEKIGSAFDTFQRDQALKYASASIAVINSRTGEIIYARNESTGLAPASTLKTITAATAYSILGSYFKYETDLLYSGKIDSEGVLQGNIIIKGNGDPSLGSDNFAETKPEALLRRWTNAIKSAGIKKINGAIIGDDSLFGGHTVPDGWIWVDMGQYYGAGVSALNWRENKFQVNFAANARVGDRTTLLRNANVPNYLEIINEVTVGKPGSGDQVYAFSAPYSNKVILRGSYASDLKKQIEVSLPDGAFNVAMDLKTSLSKEGILTDQEVTTAYLLQSKEKHSPTNTVLLDRYHSPTLGQLNYWFMKRSINLYGEAFLKTAALREQVSTLTKDAAEWEQQFWTKRLGIDSGALKIKDGSGLSPENRLTTLAMANILNQARKETWFGSYYENIPLNNNLKMKSGTIGGVLGYAGYHTTSDGTPLVFVLLVNNHDGKSQPVRLKMFRMLDSLKQ